MRCGRCGKPGPPSPRAPFPAFGRHRPLCSRGSPRGTPGRDDAAAQQIIDIDALLTEHGFQRRLISSSSSRVQRLRATTGWLLITIARSPGIVDRPEGCVRIVVDAQLLRAGHQPGELVDSSIAVQKNRPLLPFRLRPATKPLTTCRVTWACRSGVPMSLTYSVVRYPCTFPRSTAGSMTSALRSYTAPARSPSRAERSSTQIPALNAVAVRPVPGPRSCVRSAGPYQTGRA